MSAEYPPTRTDTPALGSFPLPLMEDEELLREIKPEAKRVARYLSYIVNGIGFLSVTCWAPSIPIAIMAENHLIAGFWHGAGLYVAMMLAAQVAFWVLGSFRGEGEVAA